MTKHSLGKQVPTNPWASLQIDFHHRGRSTRWPDNHFLSVKWFSDALVDLSFWYFLDGQGSIRNLATGCSHPLKAGVCLCMKPGMRLEARQQPDGKPLHSVYFHLDFRLRKRLLAPREYPRLPWYSEVTNPAFFEASSLHALDLLHESDAHGIPDANLLLARQIFQSMFLDLKFGTVRQATRREMTYQEQVLEKALRALKDDPKQFHNVHDLAKLCGYSESHLRALSHRLTGKSPNTLIIEARIEQAKSLLRHSNHSVGMIAELLGYDNIYYFSRQFRDMISTTPSQYRSTWRQNNVR